MKIHLEQPEIEAGIKLYIEAQGLKIGKQQLEVEFTAGRGPAGISADVAIVPEDQVKDKSETVTEEVPDIPPFKDDQKEIPFSHMLGN